MDFGFYYNARRERARGGQIRGGFWDETRRPGCSVAGNYRGTGPDV